MPGPTERRAAKAAAGRMVKVLLRGFARARDKLSIEELAAIINGADVGAGRRAVDRIDAAESIMPAANIRADVTMRGFKAGLAEAHKIRKR